MELKKTYDFFISFHRNAFKPEVGTGAEVYVYRAYNTKLKPLAAKIQKTLVGVGFRDRGVNLCVKAYKSACIVAGDWVY